MFAYIMHVTKVYMRGLICSWLALSEWLCHEDKSLRSASLYTVCRNARLLKLRC